MKKIDKNQCIRIAYCVVSALLISIVVLCLFVVVQLFNKGYASLAGYSFFRVVTPSMEPNILVGEIIVTKEVSMDKITVNDVISFKSLSPDMYGAIITHRVVKIDTDTSGEKCFLTKGDANLSVDGRYVLKDNFVGKVVWTSGDSFVASVFSFVSGRYGFVACVLLPSILIFACILSSSVKKIKISMQNLVEMTEKNENDEVKFDNLVLTKQEYDEMYNRIREGLIEEIKNSAQTPDSKTK